MGYFRYRGPLFPGKDDHLFRRPDGYGKIHAICQAPSVDSYGIVYGGEKSGKTSLLLRLHDHITNDEASDAVGVIVDFQGLVAGETAASP